MNDASSTSPAQYAEPGDRPSNGLGPTAVVLGVVGVLFGIFPYTFFLAALFGVTGVLVGLAGHRRCKRGEATNGPVAMFGAVISGAACVMACIDVVILIASSQ